MVVLRILHFLLPFLLLLFVHPSLSFDCAGQTGVIVNCHSACFRDSDGGYGCDYCPNGINSSCHSAPQTGRCCCQTDKCNEESTVTTTESAPVLGTPAILGIVAAVTVVSIILIVAIVICVMRRKMKNKQKNGGDYSALENDKSSMQMSAPYKVAMDSDAEQMVEHEDYSKKQILPTMEVEDKKEVIESMAKPPEIPGFDEFKEPPRLTRLITYGTNDAITVIEDEYEGPTEFPDDDEGFCAKVLAAMINNGPRQYAFTIPLLKRILSIGERKFAAEPSLLTIQVPCTIYGDIHGQYSDLHRWLNINGWPNKRRSLFLGDFVDRGSHGVEVIAMLCCMKTVFPKSIFVVRGNHEEETLNKAYSFFNEVGRRFKDTSTQDNIYTYFKKVFMQLPLAAIIGKKILGMHGGISPKLNSLQDILDIQRPIDDFEVGTLACDLVWSDPDLGRNMQQFRPNIDREPKAGIGQLFSSTAVIAACKRLGVDIIVRGHQAPLHGYAKWAGGRLFTLFSAPGYKGDNEKNVNMGACMDVNESGELAIKQIKVTTEFRKNRIHDVANRDNVSDRSDRSDR